MSSTSQFCITKKTCCKNGKRTPVVKALRNGNTKKLIKQQFAKEEKINHFFFPQNNHKLQSKPDLKVAVDGNSNNKQMRFEKENETNIPASAVGFLKMSPYRSNHNLVPMNFYGKTKKAAPAKNHQNDDETSKKCKATKPAEKKLTECYPVRRSGRKTISIIKKEKEDRLIDAVLSNQEDGLKVVEFSSKGRGVVATRNFFRNEFVVEYAGDLIEWPEAKQRERFYATNPAIGCYMYYFSAKSRNFCIDATSESGRLGRLLNHSRKSPNCYTKLVWVPDPQSGIEKPHLVILAKRDVDKDEELTYDYGDRDRAAVEVHPWLKS